MGFTIPKENITHRFAVLSPRQARDLRATTMYDKQRNLDQTYVKEYRIIQGRHEWRPATGIDLGEYKDREFLLNGSHTLEAMGGGTDDHLVSILTYKCRNEGELYELYLTYDRNRLRTLDQLYAAFGFGDRHNLNKTQTRNLGASMQHLATGFGQVEKGRTPFRMLLHSGPIRIGMMESWVDEANEYFDIVSGCPSYMKSPMRRSVVVAMALATLRHAPEKATRFWHNVAWDDRLSSDDPQKTLNRFLREHPLSEHQAHIYSSYLSSAWNAVWNNQSRLNLAADGAVPILLEGTPHTKKESRGYLTQDGTPLYDPEPCITENNGTGIVGENATDG